MAGLGRPQVTGGNGKTPRSIFPMAKTAPLKPACASCCYDSHALIADSNRWKPPVPAGRLLFHLRGIFLQKAPVCQYKNMELGARHRASGAAQRSSGRRNQLEIREPFARVGLWSQFERLLPLTPDLARRAEFHKALIASPPRPRGTEYGDSRELVPPGGPSPARFLGGSEARAAATRFPGAGNRRGRPGTRSWRGRGV